jgi:hypothetical protein
VQRDERHIRRDVGEPADQIGTDVDRGDAMAEPAQ